MSPTDINIDYAADDSCQIQLWAKGHIERDEFINLCEHELCAWDNRIESLSARVVIHTYWRTIPAPADQRGVCDYIHIESKPGRGAYAVTVLNHWLPMHKEQA